MTSEEKDEIFKEFNELVNMSPKELETWLQKEESKEVGQDSGDGESIGHKSGKKIIRIKRRNKDELTSADYEHMQKVNGYIKRHLAQRPSGDVRESAWRYSLMNWGHDPLK
ncbi:MAG TPA: DUF3140 domain-containing protein [Salinimicrobium catena]|uniref:DUF3140 domain-containing protein n=1 Tax=Salinimicrobium catena TaxID=390640 RepID=A0A7C2M503_9FLAO|nr:DUF3140 domain-containing protein [Salinimicrobium catena]